MGFEPENHHLIQGRDADQYATEKPKDNTAYAILFA